jgi:transcriptional regulator with GAF, ATPase, and Fis domain
MTHEPAIRFPVRSASDPGLVDYVGARQAIVGSSDTLRYVMHRVDRVAPTNATVLLLGETGTGKELVARAVHERSPRHHRSFVVVDCGALPAALIESELFGRERGAFTGAHTSQAGRFELADGGTVFLDEIAELPLELQPKLLRVLQQGQVARLGATRTARIDVRIVAATNRNLTEEVRLGRFRRDLFYRLNVFPISLPSLRERREDLPALVRYLTDQLSQSLGKPVMRITPGTLQALERYDWPGNIRELENVLQQGIILARDGVLDLCDFKGEPMDSAAPPSGTLQSLAAVEQCHIQYVLERLAWRIEGAGGAAQVLGLAPSTLRTRMHKLGIERPRKPQPA